MGQVSNFSMARELGATMTPEGICPNFKHPSASHDVHIMLDACHMLKLLRNCLGERGFLLNSNNIVDIN